MVRIWGQFVQLLYRQTVFVLTILFCIGIGIAMSNMQHLASELIKSQALKNAAQYAQALREARTLYSADAVSPATSTGAVVATHDYAMAPGTIPLPATFLIELGERIRTMQSGVSVRLYSDYPFPWRKETGGPKDKFEQAALKALRQSPDWPYYQQEMIGDRPVFRYAEADILRPSCVECHNSYPGTPKTDWKLGDVRGVLEIIQPLDAITQQVESGLRDTSIMLTGLSVLGISGLTLVMGRLRQTSKELERRVIERTAELQEEQEKSEQLLLSILPKLIAERLKSGENPIANDFPEASILFADLVGFTILSQQMAPEDLVQLLSVVFSVFDGLCDRHQLEKIKTIGDAYMVVGGLPSFRHDHTESVAAMALDMQHEIAQLNIDYQINLSLRIGINVGPVVAGVIGQKKFIYDLWGDAVNVASRMESHSLPGKIHVTEKVYHCLKGQFQFEARGIIPIKGKGEMRTYFLTGR
ncbi:MAG: adenylate/guanylate cyclase domain-containing protein [Microcoleaceae cyanobacterium]